MTNPVRHAITSLLADVSDRITAARLKDVEDYVSEHEWDDAMNVLGNALSEKGATLSAHERQRFKSILAAINVPASDYDFVLA